MSDYYIEQASANVSGNSNEQPNAVHSFVHSHYESVDALNADFRGAVVSRPTLGQTAIGVDNSG